MVHEVMTHEHGGMTLEHYTMVLCYDGWLSQVNNQAIIPKGSTIMLKDHNIT